MRSQHYIKIELPCGALELSDCSVGNMTTTSQVSPSGINPANPLGIPAQQGGQQTRFKVTVSATVEAWVDGGSLAEAIATVEDRIEKAVPGGTVLVQKGTVEKFRV